MLNSIQYEGNGNLKQNKVKKNALQTTKLQMSSSGKIKGPDKNDKAMYVRGKI